jgi:hypothetical protein
MMEYRFKDQTHLFYDALIIVVASLLCWIFPHLEALFIFLGILSIIFRHIGSYLFPQR